MKNADRDSVRRALLEIVGELEAAERVATEKAHKHAADAGLPGHHLEAFVTNFKIGWMGDQVNRTSARIRALVDVYLTPKTPGRPGRR